jgi:hypothetical protein
VDRYERLTIQVDPATVAALDELAQRRDRSVSHLVRQAVQDYLAGQGFSVPATLGRNTRRALRRHAQEQTAS